MGRLRGFRSPDPEVRFGPQLSAMGKSELPTRFLLGPAMLLVVGLIYYVDLRWAHGLAAAVMLGLLGVAGVIEFVRMFKNAGFPVAPVSMLGCAFGVRRPVLESK